MCTLRCEYARRCSVRTRRMCRRPPQTSTHRRHCACCVTSARYALSPHATVIFFWSFYIVVLFILLNMFISIIMEAAEEVACDFPPTFHPPKPYFSQVKDGIVNRDSSPSSVPAVGGATPADEHVLEPCAGCGPRVSVQGVLTRGQVQELHCPQRCLAAGPAHG